MKKEKSTGLTILFSFLPGLGHVYLGAYRRGIGIGAIFALLVTLNSRGIGGLEPLFGVATAFLWFFGIFDAVRICKAINAGTETEAGILAPGIPKPSARAATLTWGIILMGVGGLIVANEYLDIERFFDFIHDKIGFIFIGLGFVLLAAYARRRSRERDLELAPAPEPVRMVPPETPAPPPPVAT
jgi:hypothetical protein